MHSAKKKMRRDGLHAKYLKCMLFVFPHALSHPASLLENPTTNTPQRMYTCEEHAMLRVHTCIRMLCYA
jgi:hypothetical protein